MLVIAIAAITITLIILVVIILIAYLVDLSWQNDGCDWVYKFRQLRFKTKSKNSTDDEADLQDQDETFKRYSRIDEFNNNNFDNTHPSQASSISYIVLI